MIKELIKDIAENDPLEALDMCDKTIKKCSLEQTEINKIRNTIINRIVKINHTDRFLEDVRILKQSHLNHPWVQDNYNPEKIKLGDMILIPKNKMEEVLKSLSLRGLKAERDYDVPEFYYISEIQI